MFELLIIHDEVLIKPEELKEFHSNLEAKFKDRYTNKVIPGSGLCLKLKSIEIKDKIVVQGEGSVQVKVIFFVFLFYKAEIRMVVFKPEINEILIGTVIA